MTSSIYYSGCFRGCTWALQGGYKVDVEASALMDDAATALRKQRQFQIEEKRKRLEGLRQRRKDKQRSQYSFQPSSNAPSSVIKHAEGK